MPSTAPQQPPIAPGESRIVSISFDGMLDAGETIATVGDDDVTITPDGSLTAASVAKTTAEKTINGVPVAAGRAVTMQVSGADSAVEKYKIVVQPTTDSTPAQTPKGIIYVPVKEA